jgi:hypothetical protein
VITTETPPPPPAAEVVVVSRRDNSEVVASQDLPLVLAKGARREEALVRRAVFVTASLTVTRAATDGAAPDRYRWTYRSFLQRQVCFTSMTGLFSCTEPEVEKLPDVAEGDAPISPDPQSFPLADAARATLVSGLKARAPAVFAADRRATIDPVFKASGVTAQAPGAAARRKP